MDGYLSEIQEISMDGFRVVSAEMFQSFQRTTAPSMTLWINSISFNKSALTALNSCERVRIEVNMEKRMILVVPVTIKDKDNVRWVKGTQSIQTRRIEAHSFTSVLFKNWGWDREYVYRASGKIVASEKKVMLLFEFENSERWKYGGSKKAEKNG